MTSGTRTEGIQSRSSFTKQRNQAMLQEFFSQILHPLTLFSILLPNVLHYKQVVLVFVELYLRIGIFWLNNIVLIKSR